MLVKWTVPRIAGRRVAERVLGRDRDVKALPAVALAGALTTKCVAAAALTVTALRAGDRAGGRVGGGDVWLPAVFSVTLKVPVPLVKRGVGRQHGRRVAAGEVDRAGVARGRVVDTRPRP